MYELFNQLQWEANSVPGSTVAGYFIYRNGVKIATLSASTFEYEDHNIKKGATTLYSVAAFDVHGNQSLFSTIEIK